MGQRTRAWSIKSLMLLGCWGVVSVASAQQDADLGDLRFGAAYVRAHGLSPDLSEATAALAVANSLEKTAKAAELPQIGLKGDYDWRHEHVDGDYYGVTNINRADTFNRYAYGLGLTQAVYRPDLFRAVDLAKINVTAAEFALDEAEAKLAVQLTTDYLAVVSTLETLRARYANLSSTIEQQRQIENRQSSGLAKDSDVAQVRAARASAEADKIDAEDNVEAARLKLALTVGGSFKRVGVLKAQTPLPALTPADLGSWITTALDKRPALAAAKAGVEAARVSVDLSKSRRLPHVDVVGSQAWFDAHGGISGARLDIDRSIGVQVTVPVFTGGAITADVSRANAKLDQAQAAEQVAELQIKNGVQRAWLNATSAFRQIDARRRAVEAATDAEQSTKVGLDVGTATTADWLLSVRRRYDAERDYAQERISYLQAVIQLKAAAGVLNREDMARTELLLGFPDPGWPMPPDVSAAEAPAVDAASY